MKTRGIYFLFLAGLVVSLAAQDPDMRRGDRPRSILVSGDGEASVAPDKAVVRLGTMVQNSQAGAAQVKVNEIMQKALDEIAKAGVPKKSIRTTGLTLSPVYSGSEGQRVSAFRANNSIEVTLEDIKLVGKVIDAGIAAGANDLQGVSFGLRDDLPQRSEALTIAAKEARSKAETLAKALDLKLGNAIEVNEGGVQVVPRMAMYDSGVAGARMMAAKAPTSVEPGEVRVRASVTVRYEIGR